MGAEQKSGGEAEGRGPEGAPRHLAAPPPKLVPQGSRASSHLNPKPRFPGFPPPSCDLYQSQKPHPLPSCRASCGYKRISRLWSDPMLARGLFQAAGSQNSALLWQRGARSLFCRFAAVNGHRNPLTVCHPYCLPALEAQGVCVSVGTDSPAVHPASAHRWRSPVLSPLLGSGTLGPSWTQRGYALTASYRSRPASRSGETPGLRRHLRQMCDVAF